MTVSDCPHRWGGAVKRISVSYGMCVRRSKQEQRRRRKGGWVPGNFGGEGRGVEGWVRRGCECTLTDTASETMHQLLKVGMRDAKLVQLPLIL